jgi:hypothetical protein
MGRTGHLTQDVLAILGEVRQRFDGDRTGRRLSDMRRESTETVARRTGRVVTTLHDALTRRLGLSAGQFDQLLEEWLLRGSPGLCDHFVEKASHDADRAEIYRFFSTTLPPESPRLPPQPTPQALSVKLDEDVALVFRNSRSVNETLRAIIRVARMADNAEAS